MSDNEQNDQQQEHSDQKRRTELQGTALERFQRIGRALGLNTPGSSGVTDPENIAATATRTPSASPAPQRTSDVPADDGEDGPDGVNRDNRAADGGVPAQIYRSNIPDRQADKRRKRTGKPDSETQRKRRVQEAIQKQKDEVEREFMLDERVQALERNRGEIDALVSGVEEGLRAERAEARRRAEKKLVEIQQESEEARKRAQEQLDALTARKELVEQELREKQRLEDLLQANSNFRNEHRSWLVPIAGMLGMESDKELLVANESGVLNFSAHLISARDAALSQLGGLVGRNEAKFEDLKAEHTFLHLVALHYMKFDTFRTLRQQTKKQLGVNLNADIDRVLYKLLRNRYSLMPDEISQRFLGKLNDCGGCLC